MIHFETLIVTLGLLLGIVALTTIAAIANKVYSNREADSKRRFLDELRRAFLKLRSPDGQREAMAVIVRSMTGRWSELAAVEISQLELPLRLDVLRHLEEAGIVARLLRDAKSRLYRYRVWTRDTASVFDRGRSLHWPRPLDREAITECARVLRGDCGADEGARSARTCYTGNRDVDRGVVAACTDLELLDESSVGVYRLLQKNIGPEFQGPLFIRREALARERHDPGVCR